MGKVRVIPSTINPLTHQSIVANVKRKVAAYARVSTDSDEQYTSYEAQVNYYTGYIQSRVDWEYINVYADEGISGTNTKKRVQFNKMIEDALEGKINLIITKSISRFARNTLDTISYIRKLKAAGVEVFFEKENLWTFDSKSEMVLSMLAAIAQEESRSISENVKIGKRWGFKEGKVSMPYKIFLGYDKVDGKIVINEEQAKVVRLIYRLYAREGYSRAAIADYLNEMKVPKPSNPEGKWSINNITAILTNEKYKGDALLQKGYVDNYLDHTVKKNKGVLPQYYVENSHPAIIDKDEWNMVQEELKKRDKFRYAYSKNNPFSSKLICGCCGHFYGLKVWHSNTPYRKEIMQCNKKYSKNGDKCDTPSVLREDVNKQFIEAYNAIMVNKEEVIKSAKELIELLTDTNKIDKKIEEINGKLSDTKTLVENLIHDNAFKAQDQDAYIKKYNSLTAQYEILKQQLDEAISERDNREIKSKSMNLFITDIKEAPIMINEFDLTLWNIMIDEAIVNKDGSITFKFKNGMKYKN